MPEPGAGEAYRGPDHESFDTGRPGVTTVGPDGAGRRDDVEALRAEVATMHESLAELRTELDELRRSLGG